MKLLELKKLPLAMLLASAGAMAQSSVTIYGILTEGIGWVNNENGVHNFKLLSGVTQNNRWGFLVQEDLGGGMRAVAQLENGFDITNGKLQQGGREFGRQVFVGLRSDKLGTVTLGRQYDLFWDYLGPLSVEDAGVGVVDHPGDGDNLLGSWRFSNSVKYVTPTVKGFNASAMYAFSNAAGEFTLNRGFSGGFGYEQGPVKLGFAYTELDRPGTTNSNGAVSDDYSGAPFFLFRSSPLNRSVGVKRQRNVGIAGRYTLGPALRWNFLYDNVHYFYLDGSSLSMNNYETFVSYNPTPRVALNAGYTYTQGTYGGLSANPHWNTAQLSVDFALSKRTDVYIFDDFQKVSGPRAVADIYLNAPSTSKSQNLLVAGIRHRF